MALGLPAALTAASFGKLINPPPPEARLSTDDGAGADSWAAAFLAPPAGGGLEGRRDRVADADSQ